MSARMGRRRSKDFDLPPRMHRKGGAFYYVVGNKWKPLGTDIALAKRRWAELECVEPASPTFGHVAERYTLEVIPTKAVRTQRDNLAELQLLLKVFKDAPLDAIKPVDLRRYLDIRGVTARVRANRERALFSHIFNWARDRGYTDAPNPAAGVRGFKETGRKVYVPDEAFDAVYEKADRILRDAMDLAYYGGQRPADVLRWKRTDIVDGALELVQAKTGKRIRIKLEGDFGGAVARMLSREQKVKGLHLVQTDDGQPVTYQMLRTRFQKAREAAKVDFQFRDLRAKAATDTGDLAHSQSLLGHKSRSMTERYVRERRGDLVRPVKRRILEDIRSRADADSEKPA